MQKLTPGYILTKFILFILLNIVGICFSVMFLQIAKDTAISPALSRAIAGGIGLAFWCLLQFRTMRDAKLDSISARDYIIGEVLSALLVVIIATVVCAVLGSDAMTDGFKTAVLLPFLPFAYLTDNLYIGLVLQTAFYALFNTVCYTVKKKTDPTLLGRKKGGNKT